MNASQSSPSGPGVIDLVREAERQGGKRKTLAQLVEAASEQGALRALSRVGLHDKGAGDDIRELRDLLEAWRQTRHTAWHTFVRWMTTIFILAILAGLALRFKLPIFNN